MVALLGPVTLWLVTYFFKILWPCRQSMNIKSRNKCWHATAELYNTCKIASIVLPMKEWSFLLYRAKLQGPNQNFSSFSEWINALWLSHFSFICKWKTQKIMGVIWHCFALCCDVTDMKYHRFTVIVTRYHRCRFTPFSIEPGWPKILKRQISVY